VFPWTEYDGLNRRPYRDLSALANTHSIRDRAFLRLASIVCELRAQHAVVSEDLLTVNLVCRTHWQTCD
jgi:hypothetical protein